MFLRVGVRLTTNRNQIISFCSIRFIIMLPALGVAKENGQKEAFQEVQRILRRVTRTNSGLGVCGRGKLEILSDTEIFRMIHCLATEISPAGLFDGHSAHTQYAIAGRAVKWGSSDTFEPLAYAPPCSFRERLKPLCSLSYVHKTLDYVQCMCDIVYTTPTTGTSSNKPSETNSDLSERSKQLSSRCAEHKRADL